MYKINLSQLINIFNTNKEFIIFISNKDKIETIHFTNDLHRHYKPNVNHFRVVEQIKQDIKQQLKFYI